MTEGSFDWRSYLKRPSFEAVPVTCFKHVPLSHSWGKIVPGIFVEIRSPDCLTCSASNPCCFWVANVVKIFGYLAQLRFVGFETDSSQDVWINLCVEPHIHNIGWCAENGMPLVPPKSIEEKHGDWKDYLVKKVLKNQSIPVDFSFKVEEHKHNVIKNGMRLEVVDKNLISAVRLATVEKVIGGRLHMKYEESKKDDDGFWCHERSPLIHPIGWAQIIGHALKGKPEYAQQSLIKALLQTYDANDATWDMFVPVFNPVKNMKFKEGMKLEAIDPLNLSTICVSTVVKVLRNNYLMIGIDGTMSANGSDTFCYHASSPCIFPVGFCEANDIPLTPPRGYKNEFKWQDYLKKTKSKAAPSALFQRDIPNHGFKEGMYLEAVDLMEPRLICVASVKKVVGRLLRIHFDGWDDAYDQWCDSESPDLYPVGWCEIVGYRLEPPRSEETEDTKRKRKGSIHKPRRRKRLFTTPRRKYSDDTLEIEKRIKSEPDDFDDTRYATHMPVEDSDMSTE